MKRKTKKKAKRFDKGSIATYNRTAVGELRDVEIISRLKSLDERQLVTRKVTNRWPPVAVLSRDSFSIRVPAGNGGKARDN